VQRPVPPPLPDLADGSTWFLFGAGRLSPSL
jgi:hypothetical protein